MKNPVAFLGYAILIVGIAVAILLYVQLGSISWAITTLLGSILAYQSLGVRTFKRWVLGRRLDSSVLSKRWHTVADVIASRNQNARNRSRMLMETLQRIRAISDFVPDAWVILINRNEIEMFNASARELLGLVSSDVGNELTRLIRNPSLVHMLNAKDVDLIEMTSPVDDSKRLEVRIVELDQERTLLLMRDVTELNRLLTMRQDFIANVSHELRTPLTVMRGYVESMVNDELDLATMHSHASKLVAPEERMRSMVDDLLTLTKLESAPMPSDDDVQVVNGKSRLELVVEEVSILTEDNVKIQLNADPDIYVACIPKEIHSAFLNLITNAIRYSPDGGDIDVNWFEYEGKVRFEVVDQGIGIPAEFISRLTERFYRIDMKGSRARGGTGLGLAIVKHVLRRHQSELQIKSETGKGSSFYFDLEISDFNNREAISSHTAELAN